MFKYLRVADVEHVREEEHLGCTELGLVLVARFHARLQDDVVESSMDVKHVHVLICTTLQAR